MQFHCKISRYKVIFTLLKILLVFESLDWYISSFCKILSHHFFNYGLCSYSLSPQIKCILPSMTVNPIFILLSLYNLFCIFFLIYISIHLPISSVGNFLLNPDIESNWGYILFFISRSFTWLFFIC